MFDEQNPDLVPNSLFKRSYNPIADDLQEIDLNDPDDNISIYSMQSDTPGRPKKYMPAPGSSSAASAPAAPAPFFRPDSYSSPSMPPPPPPPRERLRERAPLMSSRVPGVASNLPTYRQPGWAPPAAPGPSQLPPIVPNRLYDPQGMSQISEVSERAPGETSSRDRPSR
jgi:hypothetical protein